MEGKEITMKECKKEKIIQTGRRNINRQQTTTKESSGSTKIELDIQEQTKL